ncbi:MAG: 30S ribosomal protein S20 [Candidatus Nitrospinota bacterium M3_3B_026]
MPNHKSAIKRVRQIKKRTTRNMAERSRARTAVKRVREAVESGSKEEAEKALRAAASRLNSAASKGVLKKNNASRRISRLAAQINKMG